MKKNNSHIILFSLTLILFSQKNYAYSEVIPNNYLEVKIPQVEQKIVLFPNPAITETVLKSVKNLKITSIFIYSLLGNLVYKNNFSSVNEVLLNVESFHNGKYLVRVFFEDGTQETITLIKQ